MKRFFLILASALSLCGCCVSYNGDIDIAFSGDTLAVISVSGNPAYLLLPVQESAREAQVKLVTESPEDTWMDVRLATDEVQYFVPLALNGASEVQIRRLPTREAVCWNAMKASDDFDTANIEPYRPVYHHTPLYGWMNDANGLVYKDGEWHLFFQYNPYGSVWGNMHWGHSVSRDLVHWEHLAPAIARDNYGHIFSGSAVVDHGNTAGFGEDAIIAYYTSHNEGRERIHTEEQCMAYSTDNGRTFTMYAGNPVLWSNKGLEADPKRGEGLRDFRDPKVFWYAPLNRWYMIVSSDKEMRFYSSSDLKDWTYESAFGEGYGFAPNQFECPDFFELPIEDNASKWVMIVNINPGCLFGGSATEYFVGDFDGHTFRCDEAPEQYRFIDYGKDHYAAVTFSNAPGGRVIAVPWMSNWQYANTVPTRQFRSANGLPRELSLFEACDSRGKKSIFMAAAPVPETAALASSSTTAPDFEASTENSTLALPESGACRIEFDITPNQNTTKVNFDLVNTKDEVAAICLDLAAGRFVFDRTAAGPGGIACSLNERETDDHRKEMSVNYVDDWALGTWAPLYLCKDNLCSSKTFHINLFVDKCSVEAFVDGGRIAMTNLVFPTEAFNSLRFTSEGAPSRIYNIKVSDLSK